MKKEKYNLVLVWALILLFIGTGCHRRKSSREIFEENFEMNVNACMVPLLERSLDSGRAKSVCECLLYKFMELDPDFQFMEEEDLNRMWFTYQAEMQECLEILKD